MMDNYRKADLTGLPIEILKRMLSGEMKCILPFSLYEEDGEIVGVYNLSHTLSVSGRRYDPISILELTERILIMIEELKDNLIFPGEAVLNKDVIFIDPYFRETRLFLILREDTVGEKENVSYLLDELKELTDEKGRAYLEYFRKAYINGTMNKDRCLGLIEDLKREAAMTDS